MRITVFSLACIFLLCKPAFGQEAGYISGKITDAQQKPAKGAVVTLQKAGTSIITKTSIADEDGKFEFVGVKPDTLIFSISFIAHKIFLSGPITFTANSSALMLEPIKLVAADPKELSEVTVTGKIPFVEKRIDRTVVNPDALISNAGTTALDVLEKSPGVLVDVNGNISLKGKQGVLIYIDDKPTYLAAPDLANYLRSLPSGSIGSIEIMTTPPAKYDAAGNAGIINIRLKRVKTTGFSGGVNLSYGQGKYSKSNNSANLSYRLNKINLFSNISYNIGNFFQDLYINRTYFNNSGQLSSAFNQNTYIKMQNEGANAKLGMDYYLTKKSTLGLVLTGFSNKAKNHTANQSVISDQNLAVQHKVSAMSPMKRSFRNGSANLNYTLKLDEKGKELSFNGDYLQYGSEINQSLLSNTYAPDGTFLSKSNLISNLPATIKITTAKADFTLPLKNKAKFEAGAKASFIRTGNIANFYDEENNTLSPNYTFSNSFNYGENINAAYLNYNFSKNKLSVQTGLRFENTNISGYRYGNPTQKDSSFSRPYNNLFPTVYLMYQLDSAAKNVLSFSYGRRIDRPNYQSMNPFTYPLDRFTLYSGNPYLQPTFSNNFEIAHTWKNSITSTLHYSYVKNVISETIEQQSNTFYSRPGNIGSQHSYGISVNGSRQMKKWWTLQLYTAVMQNRFTSLLYGQDLNNSGAYWYVAPTNQFTIGKTWTAELAGTYQTSIATGQFVIVPVWSVRAGASKKIMKNKGSIKVNISDIFYTNKPGGDIKAIANSSANWNSYLDTRVFTISLSYRFSKGKALAARNTGGSDAEKNRVK